jgi:signal recognition particle subunit SRP54
MVMPRVVVPFLRKQLKPYITSSYHHRVATTKSPIIFIGTGEHMHDLEPFSVNPFVSKMLGLGDLSGLMDKVSELKIDEKEVIKRIQQGQFSLRDFNEQFQNMMKLGPLTKIMGMLPGMNEDMFPSGTEEESQKMFKKMLAMMDSMTDEELDSDGKVFVSQPTRILRVSRGSGTLPPEVEQLLRSHGAMAEMVKKMGKGGMLNMNPGKMNPSQMARMNQQMAQMMGGAPGGGGGGMPGMGQLQQMMQQLQRGGMPDLSALGNMGDIMKAFGGGMPGAGGPPPRRR